MENLNCMISFIVIGKNEGWRLRKCFDSIYNVIDKDNINSYEIIYVDSKSTDGSIDTVKAYKDIRTFLITGDCNAAVARNIGAKEAKGNIFFFIDGDMELIPNYLPQILDNDGKLIYPFISGILDDIYYDNSWNFINTSKRNKLQEGMPDSYEKVTGGLFIITSELWKSIDGMDTRFKKSQDFDLGLCLSAKGVPLCRKSILLAKHHTTSYYSRKNNVSTVKYLALLARKHSFNKHYFSVFLFSQYTLAIFCLSVCMSLLGYPLIWVLYLLLLIYKTYAAHKKDMQIHSIQLLFYFFKRDLLFISSFLFFYPDQIKLQYIQYK